MGQSEGKEREKGAPPLTKSEIDLEEERPEGEVKTNDWLGARENRALWESQLFLFDFKKR